MRTVVRPTVENHTWGQVPGVSMTLKKWGHTGVMDPFLKGHGDSRWSGLPGAN